MHERALALQQKALGPEHPEIANTLNNLGNALRELGRFAEAREQYTRALALQEKVLPPEHLDHAEILLGMGRLGLEEHRPADALPFLERALKLAPEGLRAETRILLAPALWETRKNRPRAREPATQAREDWSQQGRKADAEPSSRWLAEHAP